MAEGEGLGQVSSRRCISDDCECMRLGWGDVAKPDWLLQAAFHRPMRVFAIAGGTGGRGKQRRFDRWSRW
jgi:hypothetical protein